MTQRKAVVPLIGSETDAAGRTETEIGGIYSFGGDHFISSFGSGKLTKADIEQMAEAHFNSRQRHIKEFTGFDGPTWADVDPDTQELGRRDMMSAVQIVGLSVED